MAPRNTKSNLLRCKYCLRMMKSASLLKTHIKNAHESTNGNMDKKRAVNNKRSDLIQNNNLKKRRKSPIKKESSPVREEIVKVFCVEDDVDKISHENNQHMSGGEQEGGSTLNTLHTKDTEGYITFRCSACNMSYKVFRKLIKHIEMVHRDGLVSLFLPNLEEFYSWQTRMQETINAKYELLLKSDKKDYYLCSMYISDDNPWDYLQCPSQLIVREYERGVQVFYHPIHFQHVAFTYNPYIDTTINKYIIMLENEVPDTSKVHKEMYDQFDDMLKFISDKYKELNYTQVIELYSLVKQVSTTLRLRLEANSKAVNDNKLGLEYDQKVKLIDNEVNKTLKESIRKAKLKEMEQINKSNETMTYEIEMLHSDDDSTETIIPDSINNHITSIKTTINQSISNEAPSNQPTSKNVINIQDDDTDIEEEILKSVGKKDKDIEEEIIKLDKKDKESEPAKDSQFANFNDTYKSFIELELNKRKQIGIRKQPEPSRRQRYESGKAYLESRKISDEPKSPVNSSPKEVPFPKVTKVWSESKEISNKESTPTSSVPFKVYSAPKAVPIYLNYEVREQEEGCNILILKI